ncbi:hypothetical protein CsSME_00041379 [Camellia sinensis var. sinensis]
MKGRVFIRSDSFACDYHCSVRLMKTHERSRRSHLTSPSGRSSRTSSSHHPISGTCSDITVPLCWSFSLSVDLSLSLSISAANHRFLSLLVFRPLCRSRPQITGFSLFLSRSFSLSHLSHMEALWRSSDAKIDKAQPAIEIRLEFWGE